MNPDLKDATEEPAGESGPAPAAPPAREELSKEDILLLPIRCFQGPVIQVPHPQEIEPCVARLRQDSVLGFDTETRPTFQRGPGNPPALVQLASGREAALFRLKHLAFPNALVSLLQDPAVLKVGVGLADDVRKLQGIFSFHPAGFVDLIELAGPLGFKAAGLRNLAANLLGFRITKGPKTSNWEREPLSPAQVSYAATDAWVGRELYLRLRELAREARERSVPVVPPLSEEP